MAMIKVELTNLREYESSVFRMDQWVQRKEEQNRQWRVYEIYG